MFQEIKRYLWVCDLCGEQSIQEGTYFDRPTGWKVSEPTNPHSITERSKDVCDKCQKVIIYDRS